jgi:hypothetical protein
MSTDYKTFNILGRIIGVLFAVFGMIGAIYGAGQRDGLIVVVCLVVAVLGVLMVIAKPRSKE